MVWRPFALQRSSDTLEHILNTVLGTSKHQVGERARDEAVEPFRPNPRARFRGREKVGGSLLPSPALRR